MKSIWQHVYIFFLHTGELSHIQQTPHQCIIIYIWLFRVDIVIAFHIKWNSRCVIIVLYAMAEQQLASVQATPSGCLVSGPPPKSNYNNCKLSPLLAFHMCNYVVCHFTHADLYSEGLFIHYQLVSRCQILSQGCHLLIRDYKCLLDLQPISATPMIRCGNARLFVSLNLKIRISVATIHLHSHI